MVWTTAPIPDEYCPAEQAEQVPAVTAPLAVENVPAEHGMHGRVLAWLGMKILRLSVSGPVYMILQVAT